MDAIWAALTRLYGEVGASQAGLSLINFDTKRKVAVVRVLLACMPQVRAALATVTIIGGVETALHILAVSGTLKALFSNF